MRSKLSGREMHRNIKMYIDLQQWFYSLLRPTLLLRRNQLCIYYREMLFTVTVNLATRNFLLL